MSDRVLHGKRANALRKNEEKKKMYILYRRIAVGDDTTLTVCVPSDRSVRVSIGGMIFLYALL